MLKNLRLRDVGPAPSFISIFRPAQHLHGRQRARKSFILDIVWWIWTGTWAGFPASPRRERVAKPLIDWHLTGNAPPAKSPTKSSFNFQCEEWPHNRASFVTQALVVYARVDGGFSVLAPCAQRLAISCIHWQNGRPALEWGPRAFQFPSTTL